MADINEARASENRLATLIDGWLDGVATLDDIGEMQSLLLESSEARREFWRRAAFHGQLHEAARMKFASLPADDTCGRRSITRGGWQRTLHVFGPWLAGSLLLATVAAMLGAGVTSLALAYSEKTAVAIPSARRVHFESFESGIGPRSDYIPRKTDVWGGDETRVIQGPASEGVRPKSGGSMLRFVSSHPSGEMYRAHASEVWRFIDVAELRSEAGTESLDVEFSAWFNTVAADAGQRPHGGLSIVATNVPPSDWDNALWEATSPFDHGHAEAWRQPLATAAAQKRLDADPHSWQPVTTILAVPPEARYLLLHCYVVDHRATGAETDQFPGQFVDDIEVRIAGNNRYGIGKTAAVGEP